MKFLLSSIAIVALIIGAVAYGHYGRGYFTQSKDCETFAVMLPDQQYGTVYIGYRELCGYRLEWGNVKGPLADAEGAWR